MAIEQYTHFSKQGDKVRIRGITAAGERYTNWIGDFKPELFVKTPKDKVAEATSISGVGLSRVEMDSISSATKFVREYEGVHGYKIYGYTRWAHQFASHYWDLKKLRDLWSSENIRQWFMDIETTVSGPIDIDGTPEEVNIVTVYDSIDKKKYVFATGDWDKKRDDVVFIRCFDERQLLDGVLKLFMQQPPDILTGWNLAFYDVPYIIRRMIKILGDGQVKYLSPFLKVKGDLKTDQYGDTYWEYKIDGIEILDLKDVYKKFVLQPRENYKLDTIGQVEVKETKLKHHSGLPGHLLYKDFFSDAVDYNIQDVDLIVKIDAKRNLLALVMSVAYDSGVNFSDVMSQIRVWSNIIYLDLYEQGIMLEATKVAKERPYIVGGYVKEPIVGKHDWVVTVDATSEYPSLIRALNISPETLVENYEGPSGVENLLYNRPDLSELKTLDYAMGANGVCFTRAVEGIMPRVTTKKFNQRQSAKKDMLFHKNKAEELKAAKFDIRKIEEHELQKIKSDLKQGAAKVQLNSLYGASANEHFMFFDPRIAEAITMSGQLMIRTVLEALNKYINRISGTEGVDYVIAVDTDSVMFSLGAFVKKALPEGTPDDVICDALDKFIADKVQKVMNAALRDLTDRLNARVPEALDMKREAIASEGIFTGKKQYALNVLDNEGVRFAEPDLKITGLAAIKSATPGPIREKMKEVIKIMLRGNEGQLQDKVLEIKNVFFTLPPDEIAKNQGVDALSKYEHGEHKSIPQACKAALTYNTLIKKRNLSAVRTPIKSGEKIKTIYLLSPNKAFVNHIGWVDEFPVEFDLDGRIDYETQFNKVFVDGIKKMAFMIGWDPIKKNRLSMFD